METRLSIKNGERRIQDMHLKLAGKGRIMLDTFKERPLRYLQAGRS